MNITEHLQRIKAKCKELLVTAEERTPGKWMAKGYGFNVGFCHGFQDDCDGTENGKEDAAFIASCAGNAEAGWLSTKAAIDTIHIMQRNRGDQGLVTETLDAVTEALTTQILAAWPLELITKHQ